MTAAPLQDLIDRLPPPGGRPADPADRGRLRQMVMADAQHMLGDIPAAARSLMVSVQVESRLANLCRGREDSVTLLLGPADQPMGMMLLDPASPGGLSLLELMVLPDHRNKGYGNAALAALCAHADAGQSPIQCRLFFDNPIRRLLTRHGFTMAADHGIDIVMRRPAMALAAAL